MIIQSKKVWIADQFMPAQIEIENGKIDLAKRIERNTYDYKN